MRNGFTETLLSAGGGLGKLWDFMSSKYAIFVYVLLLTAIVVCIILAVMKNEGKGTTIVATGVPVVAQGAVAKTSESKKEEEDGEERSRFYMLCEIDTNRARYQKSGYDESVTLKGFCEAFRNYACSKLRLYYSIDDIRRFIAGLAVTKILILQGMSGTGKTSLAYAFGEFLENSSTVVPVQPMWKERTDLVGYYNEFTKRFNETTLLQKMYEANYSKDIYITILDEMNIARVEYYFAEFLSLLELPNPDRRYL
ncbi:MAG: AAA family ATPase, partial [Clostridia bacterium]|nr:AAA family ATPase [Clostridia bacterium]